MIHDNCIIKGGIGAVWYLLLSHILCISAQTNEFCYIPCENVFSGKEVVPGTGCQLYQICNGGVPGQLQSCGDSLLYDPIRGYCHFTYEVECPVDPTCPPSASPVSTPTPTDNPTGSPSMFPTKGPTSMPTKQPSGKPTLQPTPSPTVSPTLHPTGLGAMDYIKGKQSLMEQYVLVSYTAAGIAYPSIRYTFDGFIQSLQIMGVDGFGADFQFFLGDGDVELHVYGLVNLAVFLANCMAESIKTDTCDELNWQEVAGRYALSNSCGQEGRSYQDEDCGELFSCVVDYSMEMTAVTSGNQIRAPPPLMCRPGSGPDHYSGYWDTSSGSEISNTPYSNTAGRTDTEGCCWWGRGALLTRNVCNIGKFNYYVGKKAADLGRQSLYPTVDFCDYPEATCASAFSEELRWTTAFFEWAERIQRYKSNGWVYEEQLTAFVDGGLIDESFLATVNRIFAHNCHEAGCTPLEVRFADERKAHFYTIINDVFNVQSLIDQINFTPMPTPKLTIRPSPPDLSPDTAVTPMPQIDPPMSPSSPISPPTPPISPSISAVPAFPSEPMPSPGEPTDPAPSIIIITPSPTEIEQVNPTFIIPPWPIESDGIEKPTELPTSVFEEIINVEDNHACQSNILNRWITALLFNFVLISQLL